MVMEGAKRCSANSEEEMPSCALESQGRLPKKGTPELVLKEEQGPVRPEEGSLAGETGSDAGWPVTQKNLQQKLVGGHEGLASNQDFTPGSQEWLKHGESSSLTWPCFLRIAQGLGCQTWET